MKGIIVTALSLFLWACSQEPYAMHEVHGEAQGTTYTVKYMSSVDQQVKGPLDSLLKAIDESMSTYLPTSLISELNKGDSVEVDEKFKEVFLLSQRINEMSSGAFDPSIGPLIKAWGFDYSAPQLMDTTMVDSMLAFCGFQQFQLEGMKVRKKDSRARLNFNAVAQGYAVDLMAKLLDEEGIKDYFIELGGEIKVKGKNDKGTFWRIGIDKPEGKNLERKLKAIISLENKALATSGNYRKFYELNGRRYSHTLNPKSGFPAGNSLLSATVIATNCADADALATAFMVMGVEKSKAFLEKHKDLDVFFIYATDTTAFETYATEGLKKQLEEL
jgi:thiamine biosynthesis lipoprotein